MGYLDNGSQVIVLPSQYLTYLTSDEQRDILVEILKRDQGQWFFAARLEIPFRREISRIERKTGRRVRSNYWTWWTNKIGLLLRYEKRITREKVHHWNGYCSSKLYRYTYIDDPNNIEWWLKPK